MATEKNGLYVKATFGQSTRTLLVRLQGELGLSDPVLEHDLHLTLVYSRVAVPWRSAGVVNEHAKAIGYECFKDGDRSVLVLLLYCPFAVQRHNQAQKLGATYDFPIYRPHVTLGSLTDVAQLARTPVPTWSLGLVRESHHAIRKP